MLISVRNNAASAKIATRARGWLLTAVDALQATESLPDLISVLTGLYLCDVLAGGVSSPESLQVGGLLTQYLEAGDDQIDPEVCGTSRLLLAHCILSSFDLPAGTLTRFALDTAAVMATPDKSPVAENASILLLLCRLGLLPFAPQAGTLTEADLGGSALELLLAPEGDLRRICHRIASASLCGTATILGSPEALWSLAQALPSVALQRLRIYDLELGALLLRSLAYLNADQSHCVKSGLRFLEGQQRGEGAFGHFAFELACAEPPLEAVASRRFYLSATVTCLWTIAELRVPGFRLGIGPSC